MILGWICTFTFLIHFSETLAYTLRLAGIRTRQVAIALSFVTSTLLISRLSNMFQAPFLGALVDKSILITDLNAIEQLVSQFRVIIFAGFLGTLFGMMLTPSVIKLFEKAIMSFLHSGSIVRTCLSFLRPKNLISGMFNLKMPSFSQLKTVSFKGIPKQFLILNVCVTAIYTIGVLCSLLAGAYLPEIRSTAIQLSGIVNGMATIMLTLFVDPAGARITDQAYQGNRPENDVRSVVFFLQLGKAFGTLVLAQLMLIPLTKYIMMVTLWIAELTIPL